jgi:DNA invertase Pin-like site-specific DNA recombinase
MPSTNGHGSKPERVALYLRVSSEEQRDAGTIETQREFLDGYVRLHGLEVAGVYEDDGVSGTSRCMSGREAGGYWQTPRRADLGW